ncbi:MAG: glycoside hydrolase family 57 protein [Prevotella sp.]|nr:glycoside hydrolase family 57 protein [Bacteroides sp.]MCM1365950.1 glycoside hydrolase family 57 protein [Prevotella sp.]MCM1436629.1 glycoside hydrolase family 57 protein [Prevotella sp.]
MKTIALYFKIHQPYRLKRYRFFDIGNDHYYYDDFANDDIITRIAHNSYIPTAQALLEIIAKNGNDFKCAISISGTALEQLQVAAPEFIELLKKLANTGCVEFLSETYSHDLSSIEDPEEFIRQIKLHDDVIKENFGLTPTVFQNTELIFDDDIALLIGSIGFKGLLTEGAKHILGWKSPNYVYQSASNPNLKLLLVNDKLSEDISQNFNNTSWSEYPLTADKYISWINELPADQQCVNLYFSMENFGNFIPAESGIFDFLKALPIFAKEKGIKFQLPTEIINNYNPVDSLSIPFPISAVDEARDVSAWRGNDLQREALQKLYSVGERVNLAQDRRLLMDWHRLQSSDHFYYMSTKNLSDGASHAAFSPYDSPFSAFTNYMNVLADFLVRVQEQFPEDVENEELNSLLLTIKNQAAEINELKKEVKSLHTDRDNLNTELPVKEEKKPTKKATAKKTSKKASSK